MTRISPETFASLRQERRERRKIHEEERFGQAFVAHLGRADAEGLGLLLAARAENRAHSTIAAPGRNIAGNAARWFQRLNSQSDDSAHASTQSPGRARRGRRARLLVLQRSGLKQDLQHGLVEQGWYGTLLPLYRGHFKQVARSVLGVDVGDFSYLTETTEDSRLVLRSYFAELLTALFRSVKAKTIVSANVAYWADQELSDAAHSAGGRLIVLHKETLMAATPAGFASYVRALRHGVLASPHRRIAVYSNSTANAFVAAGVAQRQQISVTGASRVDKAHEIGRERKTALGRHTVTFFAFTDWVGITFPGDPEARQSAPETAPPLRWTETAAGFRRAAEILSDSRPDIRVLWKDKTGAARLVDRRREREAHRTEAEYGSKTDALRLIQESAVCCAFNSTVILEAFAARVPVLSPGFGEASSALMKDSLIDFGPGVCWATSPEQLAAWAAWFVDNPSAQVDRLTLETQEVLEHLVGNPDGASGQRLQRFLEREQVR